MNGYARRVVDYLKQAVQNGFKTPEALKHPLYDPIRKRADFRALQKELEEKTKVGVG